MAKKTYGIDGGREQTVISAEVLALELRDDGIFPNRRLPLFFYSEAISISKNDPDAVFEEIFESNGWGGTWRNGIYTYHHYHSTAHEVLGIYRGSARVQLGGGQGVIQEVRAGDVIVIPAGIAHKNLGPSRDFGVVGAYPEGQKMDMNYGKPAERPRADENIARVPLPKMDPVFGENGPVKEKWLP
jgi:uncharacterized protein YjlB